MNPAYTLALKLRIPIILQPEWSECQKLLEEGRKLWVTRCKRCDDGKNLYQEAVIRELGSEYAILINWITGEILCQP